VQLFVEADFEYNLLLFHLTSTFLSLICITHGVLVSLRLFKLRYLRLIPLDILSMFVDVFRNNKFDVYPEQ